MIQQAEGLQRRLSAEQNPSGQGSGFRQPWALYLTLSHTTSSQNPPVVEET